MRLRKIRLAGFKSFVDPTTIHFPGDLIGVVGPNGCGKSNVVDAVRWVMGEVSAKHLRGDTMADVVFSGSSTRKPVSQASVELLFDNSDGRVGGRFAGYAEISVKRLVTRESASSYSINGSRARRRDVMDLFLGTGLGPRSYAIIEQGTISRIIEAKPEELRDFLEEAAGISKYKERRRETENRMRHTEENLARLTDIREELGRRIAHLQRQARQAERYKELREEQRGIEAELLALSWRGLDTEATRQAARIAEQETAFEASMAEQRRLESALEARRVAQAEASEAFNEHYRRVLDAGAAIARQEEVIQSRRERRETLDRTLARERQALEASRAQLARDADRLAALRETLAREEPALAGLEDGAAEAQAGFREAEERMEEWQAAFEALAERTADPSRVVHAERARIQQLEAHQADLARRIEHAESRRAAGAREDLQARVAELDAEREAAADAAAKAAGVAEAAQVEVRRLRERHAEAREHLHRDRQALEALKGRVASLQALQQQALGKGPGQVMDWLATRGLEARPRLGEVLRAAPGWERAVERVLGGRLEAVCVERLDEAAEGLGTLERGSLTLFEGGAAGERPPAPAGRPPRLVDQVSAPWPVDSLLPGVYTVEGLEDGLALRARLGSGESVVTREGEWLGPDWLRVAHAAGEEGVLAREQELADLTARGAELEAAIGAHRETAEELEAALSSAEDALVAAQAGTAAAHRRSAELEAAHSGAVSRLEQQRAQLAALAKEIAELRDRSQDEARTLEEARARLEASTGELERLSGEREALEAQRAERRRALEAGRARWQDLRDQLYEAGLRLQSLRTQVASLEEAQVRYQDQTRELAERCAETEVALAATAEPVEAARRELESMLAGRRGLETALGEARGWVETADAELRSLEQGRQRQHTRVAAERERLEGLRLEGQETVVRRRTVEEQLARTGRELAALLEALPADAAVEAWEERLASVERRVARLGPINLAAIEEFEQQSERKGYLDAQHADLEEALATLREAISKIDRETRARFKETFERVNSGLGTLFPRLFGGGEARLELTGGDLLSTGVGVMARPPGKRNASIHLLSGGEKALTAVALVFAIFELNPAPFCLLDEVDAPLDDANVGRFCEMLKAMAERVQFVFVTHNKLTMEIAQQLIGVTMNEAGCSRLVAVDLDAAAELATA